MNGKFGLVISIFGWSLGSNVIFVSNHFSLRLGSSCWARLISRSCFLPWVLEAIARLPPKIMLMSPYCSLSSSCAQRCLPHRGSPKLFQLVPQGPSSCYSGRSCNLPNRSRSCNGSRTISWHRWAAEKGAWTSDQIDLGLHVLQHWPHDLLASFWTPCFCCQGAELMLLRLRCIHQLPPPWFWAALCLSLILSWD
jgi:hypothetical protein